MRRDKTQDDAVTYKRKRSNQDEDKEVLSKDLLQLFKLLKM